MRGVEGVLETEKPVGIEENEGESRGGLRIQVQYFSSD